MSLRGIIGSWQPCVWLGQQYWVEWGQAGVSQAPVAPSYPTERARQFNFILLKPQERSVAPIWLREGKFSCFLGDLGQVTSLHHPLSASSPSCEPGSDTSQDQQLSRAADVQRFPNLPVDTQQGAGQHTQACPTPSPPSEILRPCCLRLPLRSPPLPACGQLHSWGQGRAFSLRT